MGYQILDRPSGTSAYPQGWGEQLAGMSGDIASSVKDSIFRKALQGSQLEPEFTVDEDGKMKITYKTKKTDVKDAQFNLQSALAGFSQWMRYLVREVRKRTLLGW